MDYMVARANLIEAAHEAEAEQFFYSCIGYSAVAECWQYMIGGGLIAPDDLTQIHGEEFDLVRRGAELGYRVVEHRAVGCHDHPRTGRAFYIIKRFFWL